MLSHVTTAEIQFRLDTAQRDRENAILASIRERSEPEVDVVHHARRTAPASRLRAAWPRPIGIDLAAADGCDTACAVA